MVTNCTTYYHSISFHNVFLEHGGPLIFSLLLHLDGGVVLVVAYKIIETVQISLSLFGVDSFDLGLGLWDLGLGPGLVN